MKKSIKIYSQVILLFLFLINALKDIKAQGGQSGNSEFEASSPIYKYESAKNDPLNARIYTLDNGL